jgi:hypothetical protein
MVAGRSATFATQIAQVQDQGIKPVKDAEPPLVKETWQQDAYAYVESIAEIGYAVNLKASTLAECRLRPEMRIPDTDEWADTDDPRVLRILRAFKPPAGEQSSILKECALHWDIAGESYLVGTPVKDEIGRSQGFLWEFLSPIEIRVENNGKAIRNAWGGSRGKGEVPIDAYIARMHHRDARYSERADSPMRRVLPICRELVLLTQMVDAVAKSRLPAGLFYIPNEFSFGPTNEFEQGDNAATGYDQFEENLRNHLGAPIEDRSAAASQYPLMMRGPAFIKDGQGGSHPAKDLMGLVNLGRDLDLVFMQLRTEALARLAAGLDIPPEVISGKSGLSHWCASEDTEVLTRTQGWVTQDQLVIGDEILTLDHNTGLSAWGPVLDLYRAPVADEAMVSIEGDRHSSLTTPNHRWPSIRGARRESLWTTSEELDANDRIVVAAAAADLPTEAKWSDALVEAVAWLWTEGNVRVRGGRRTPQVTLWQSEQVNPDYVARIRAALTALFGPARDLGAGSSPTAEPGWRDRVRDGRPGIVEFKLNSAAAEVLLAHFDEAERKVVSLSFIDSLTAAQLRLFIDASICADGTVLPSQTMQLAQADEGRITPLEVAAIRAGFSTHVYPVAGGMTMLSISRKTTFSLARKSVESVVYTGTVWCPVTPNRSWFGRRNGKSFFTGNTGYNIDADFIAKHIVPLGRVICEFITWAYLRPMLVTFEGLTPKEAEWFRFSMDTSTITANIDRSANATAGVNLGIIGDIPWARLNGLDESDVADEKEQRNRLLRQIVLADPTTAPIILPLLYPDDLRVKEAADNWPSAPAGAVGTPAPPGGTPGPGSTPAAPVSPATPGLKGPATDPAGQDRSGGKEPTPRLAAANLAMLAQLVGAADMALERALERAGLRLIGRISSAEPQTAAALRALPRKTEVLTAGGTELAARFGMDKSTLFSEEWEELRGRVQPWLQQVLVTEGDDPFAAGEVASRAADEMVEQLSTLAMSALVRPVPLNQTGTKVSMELILSALIAGDMARA